MSSSTCLCVTWILLVMLSTCIHSKNLGKSDEDDNIDEDEIWLGDRVNYYYDYMGDAPEVTQDLDVQPECPPFPNATEDCNGQGNSSESTCSENKDCHDEKICCFNGCRNICTIPPEMPIFIDWVKEPRKRLSSGISWLISGPDTAEELEPCSTTPYSEEEDPLLCPHGYACHIVAPGDSKRGLPNVGHCIPQSEKELARLGLAAVAPDDNEASCALNKYVLLDGASMKVFGMRCTCKKGELICKERNKKQKNKGTKNKRRNKKRKTVKSTPPSLEL